MNNMSLEDKLGLNKYDLDKESHIKLDEASCRVCESRECIYVCPAGCYKIKDGEFVFSYDGCLECGACRISCAKGAVDWNYPRGGFGVSFEYG